MLAGALVQWRWPVGGPEVWADGSVHGPWQAVFNGEGRTTGDDGVIELAPRAATEPAETHAGLVVSVADYGDVDFSATVHTLRQTREGTPNPWEVGWVVWHYEGPQRFYYFTLKPNGWELGKADPAYPGAQRFLATGQSPAETGAPHAVRVRQVGATVDVWVDTAHVVTSTDTETPYLRGSVGVYSEDAVVRFSDLAVAPASR
ncbi:calcium-binding protein [Kineococcus sp. T90]|nr:calcium-binding protein [Kineococcus indalonis]